MYKVYIVEDEHLEREALKMILDNQAPDVEIVGSASSGKVALEGIAETNPQIILMDINIPEINGIEVVKSVSFSRVSTCCRGFRRWKTSSMIGLFPGYA